PGRIPLGAGPDGDPAHRDPGTADRPRPARPARPRVGHRRHPGIDRRLAVNAAYGPARLYDLALYGLAGLRPGHLGLPDVPRDRAVRRLQRWLHHLQPVVDVADRGRLELARQPHDLALQLADRDLPFAVPDLKLEDRHLVGHPGDPLFLRRQQAGQPVG